MEEERKRKLVFWSSFPAFTVAIFVALWGLHTLLWLALPCLLSSSGAFPWLLVPALLPAWIAAHAVCRSLGLSRGGYTTEVLAKEGAPRSLSDRGAVAVRGRRWPWAVSGSLLGMAAVEAGAFCTLAPVFYPELSAAASLLGLASVACWHRGFAYGGVVALADDGGVLGRSLLGTERVSWDQVDDVRVDLQPGVLGRSGQTVCRFESRSGGTLLSVNLGSVSEAERDRFIEAIRAKQGLPPGRRTELEAADPPQGTGLEPEAAAAPAGRGTEVMTSSPVGHTGEAEAMPLEAGRGAGADAGQVRPG